MSSADAPSAAVRTITPPCFGAIPLDDRLQPVALVVIEPGANTPSPVAVRDEDHEAARAVRSRW